MISPANCFNHLKKSTMFRIKSFALLLCTTAVFSLAACNVYRFRDVSIDPNIKTVKIDYIGPGNYGSLNPQLSPQLSDKLRQKITNQTKLTQIQGDNPNLEISGNISTYSVGTSGISNQQAASNRLTVGVHIIVKNRVDDTKSFEADVSRNFDFESSLSLDQAQTRLTPTIVQNLTDEIFNRVFSNW